MKLLKTGCLLAALTACGLSFAAAAWAGTEVGSAPGCWSPEWGELRRGTSYRGVLSGGRERCFRAYVPSGLDRSRPAPLVLSLHGFAANADGQQANARWEALADEHGFVVGYPQGTSFPLRWNVGPGTRLEGVDDVRFVSDVIDDLSARVSIDAKRIFVTGFSNGGDMTHQVACQLADRIAAAGMVSGFAADPAGGCRPARPVPVMAFLSGSDLSNEPLPAPNWLLDRLLNITIEEIEPGPGSPQAWAEAWAQRNGCHGPRINENLAPGVTQERFTECTHDAEVILVSIPAMGHAWPGGPPLLGLGPSTKAIDASQAMWDFFVGHPLP